MYSFHEVNLRQLKPIIVFVYYITKSDKGACTRTYVRTYGHFLSRFTLSIANPCQPFGLKWHDTGEKKLYRIQPISAIGAEN